MACLSSKGSMLRWGQGSWSQDTNSARTSGESRELCLLPFWLRGDIMLLGLWLHTDARSHHSLPLSLTCLLLPSKRPRRALHSSGPFMAVSPSQGPYGHLLVPEQGYSIFRSHCPLIYCKRTSKDPLKMAGKLRTFYECWGSKQRRRYLVGPPV